MSNDEKISDLLKQVESMKVQMHELLDQIGNRSAEIFALRTITRALVATHPARDDFERALRVLHESWLANAIPSEWSDTQIDLASKTVMALIRNKTLPPL